MTLIRLRFLRLHWRKHPRVEWLVAAYLKYKPPVEDSYTPAMRSAFADMARKQREKPADIAEFFGLRPGITITG